MKIKFNFDDNSPLNEMLKLHMLTVVVRSLFEEDVKYYPQVFFKMNIQKELILTKEMHQKNVIFVIIGTF